MCRSLALLILLATAQVCSAQTVLLRYETWSTDVVAEDKALRLELDESGFVRVHRPAHWQLAGDCGFQLDAEHVTVIMKSMQDLPWERERGADLAAQVSKRDQSIRATQGMVYERSEAVLTVLTQYPFRKSQADIFAYKDLDWDAKRHPDLAELKRWNDLAASMYALASDGRCRKLEQENQP